MPLVTTRLRLAANSAARSSSYGSLNDGLLVKASLSYTWSGKGGAIKGPGWAQGFGANSGVGQQWSWTATRPGPGCRVVTNRYRFAVALDVSVSCRSAPWRASTARRQA